MAVVVSPTNPGVVYDPRLKAKTNYMEALQQDLASQAKELFAPENMVNQIGNWMPIDKEIFDPTKYPRGFMPGKKVGFSGLVGTTNGVRSKG